MKLRYLVLLLLLSSAVLSSCGQEEQVQRRDLLAFGTVVQVTIWGVEAEQAERAFTIAEKKFQQLHRQWHPWEAPGKLAEVNSALAAGQSVEVDEEFIAAIEQAFYLMEKSGGLFNPMLGYLTSLWGFATDPAPEQPPGEAMLSLWLDNPPQAAELVMADNTISSSNTMLQLDLGAFMKGHAIDLVTRRLHDLGIDNMIINAGGDLRATGQRGSRPWNIAIRHPRDNDTLASVKINDDESVFTSGDYERFFIKDGQRYHHILDPRTAWPARDTVAVSVVAKSAAVSDAAATALFVAGPGRWRQTAAAMGITYALLIDKGGNIHLTLAMAERVTINEKYESRILQSQ